MSKTRDFLLISGGCDSTYLFAKLMDLYKDDKNYFLNLVKINSNVVGKEQTKFEDLAINSLLKKYKKLYPNKFDLNKIYVKSKMSTIKMGGIPGRYQHILWMCNILPWVQENTNIYMGYVGDDENFRLFEGCNKLIEYINCFIGGTDNKCNINFKFPFIELALNKCNILKGLHDEFNLLENVFFCQSPINGTMCTHCPKCIEYISALYELKYMGYDWVNQYIEKFDNIRQLQDNQHKSK
jgi:7-cyano-7-deazaguanine synthase in queuosine biosynthesis